MDIQPVPAFVQDAGPEKTRLGAAKEKVRNAAAWLHQSPLAKTAAAAALLSLIPQIYGTSTAGFFSRHLRKISILLAVLSPHKAGDLVIKLLGAIEGVNAELKLPPKHAFRKFIKDTKSRLEADTNIPLQKGLDGVLGISTIAVGQYVVQVAASLTVRQLGRLLDTAQALAKKLDGRLPFGRAEAFLSLVALLLVGYGLRHRKNGGVDAGEFNTLFQVVDTQASENDKLTRGNSEANERL